MVGKVEIRKAKLREALLAAATKRIVENGMSELRARDLARDAGCSVGAIYNVFEDLTDLILAVNGQTFVALGQDVSCAVSASDGQPARDRLVAMSHAYMNFAADNRNLWHALFDLEMSRDGAVPEWYLNALNGLFANIAGPVSEIFPEKSDEELDLMVRTLFSAVHGIVLLGIEQRISGVPLGQVEKMISQLLQGFGQNSGA